MSRPTEVTEQELIALVDWAREFLATEVEGQYTSDAALQLALAVWLSDRPDTHPKAQVVNIKPAEEPGAPLSKPGGYLP